MYEARDYKTRIWWSAEDALYLAQVTELPGIMAHGDTRAGAFDQIQVALEGALAWKREPGDELPTPVHLDASA